MPLARVLVLLTLAACGGSGSSGGDDEEGGVDPETYCDAAEQCADDEDARFDHGECVANRDDAIDAAEASDCEREVDAYLACQSLRSECSRDGYYEDAGSCAEDLMAVYDCAVGSDDREQGFEAFGWLSCDLSQRCGITGSDRTYDFDVRACTRDSVEALVSYADIGCDDEVRDLLSCSYGSVECVDGLLEGDDCTREGDAFIECVLY